MWSSSAGLGLAPVTFGVQLGEGAEAEGRLRVGAAQLRRTRVFCCHTGKMSLSLASLRPTRISQVPLIFCPKTSCSSFNLGSFVSSPSPHR